MSKDNSAGKGDTYRKVDMDVYRKNYEEIFGKKNPNNKVSSVKTKKNK